VRFQCPEIPVRRTKRTKREKAEGEQAKSERATRRADNAAQAVAAGWRSLQTSNQAIDSRIDSSVHAIDALLSVMGIGVGHEYVPSPSGGSFSQTQRSIAQQQQQTKYYVDEFGRADPGALSDDGPPLDGPARLSAALEAVAEFAASHSVGSRIADCYVRSTWFILHNTSRHGRSHV
jgi:hypothetical protein